MEHKPWERWLFIFLLLGLAYFVAYRITDRPDVTGYSPKVDSVEKIPPIVPVTNNYPTKIIYQTIIDTTRRREAEKKDIVIGITVDEKKNEVHKQTIDSTGRVKDEVHKFEEGSKLLITADGFEEKKRTKAGKILYKSKKVILKGLQVVGGIAIIYVATKAF